MISPPLPGASIERGPSDWQVFQQDEDGRADIVLAGVYRTEAPEYRVEARVVREDDGAPVTGGLDWTAARLLAGERWELRLEGVPAGGLYRVETRVWRTKCPDPRPMRGDYVHHLGVGDLWVIAGQSNASGTGTGYVEDPPRLGVHVLGNDERWKLACHPLEDATATRHPVTVHGVFQAHSPWLAFGRRLLEELGWPVGLIPTALGGSPLARWQAGGDLYANMMDMVRVAEGRVRGIVWYQGESDCWGAERENYRERFDEFIAAVREDLGAPWLPVLTAQLGRFAGPADESLHAGWSTVREAQRRAALDIKGVALVPTVDLPLCDEIHLSAQANVALGRRFATAALRGVYGTELAEPGIRLVEAAKPAPSTVRLTFERPAAGWCLVGSGPDFTVEDETGKIEIAETRLDDGGVVELLLARETVGEVTVHAHRGCMPPVSLRDRDQRPVVAFSVRLGRAGEGLG